MVPTLHKLRVFVSMLRADDSRIDSARIFELLFSCVQHNSLYSSRQVWPFCLNQCSVVLTPVGASHSRLDDLKNSRVSKPRLDRGTPKIFTSLGPPFYENAYSLQKLTSEYRNSVITEFFQCCSFREFLHQSAPFIASSKCKMLNEQKY